MKVCLFYSSRIANDDPACSVPPLMVYSKQSSSFSVAETIAEGERKRASDGAAKEGVEEAVNDIPAPPVKKAKMDEMPTTGRLHSSKIP